MEVKAHHAALLAGAGLVHLAAEGHGVQRDVVTTPGMITNTEMRWNTDCEHASVGWWGGDGARVERGRSGGLEWVTG